MKYIILILFSFILFFSCSKEENIPFVDSVKDTIQPVFYHDISGIYNGVIRDIRILNSNSILILSSTKHSVVVSEINFDNILIENISNDIVSNAEASLFRRDGAGGFLSFIPHTMADSTGVDSIYQGFYNGIYYYDIDTLAYFFYYVKEKDTIHQLFSGKLN